MPYARAPCRLAQARMRVFLASSHRSVLRIRNPSSEGKCSVNSRCSFSE